MQKTTIILTTIILFFNVAKAMEKPKPIIIDLESKFSQIDENYRKTIDSKQNYALKEITDDGIAFVASAEGEKTFLAFGWIKDIPDNGFKKVIHIKTHNAPCLEVMVAEHTNRAVAAFETQKDPMKKIVKTWNLETGKLISEIILAKPDNEGGDQSVYKAFIGLSCMHVAFYPSSENLNRYVCETRDPLNPKFKRIYKSHPPKKQTKRKRPYFHTFFKFSKDDLENISGIFKDALGL